MKKVLKIIGIILLVIVLLILIAYLFVRFSPSPTYEVEAVDFEYNFSQAHADEGARFVSVMCAFCHKGDDNRLSGKDYSQGMDPFGQVYAANITQHEEFGIGSWSPEDIARFIKTGVKPDGSFTIQPWMPKWPLMADDDLNSIIAFLKSDHNMVQPSDVQQPEPEKSFLNKALSRVAFKPYPYKTDIPNRPDTNSMVELGKYIVNDLYICADCHSHSFETNNPLDPSSNVGYLGGGNQMPNKEGKLIPTSNITMSEDGIAHYSYDDFVNAVKWGKKPDGTVVSYPMPQFTTLTDKETEAVWAYLQTVEKQ